MNTAYCPLGCGQLYNPLHLETECANVEILCPFGCSARFKRRYLQQHKAHCPSLPPASPPPFSPPISGRDTPPLTPDAREMNGHTITVSPAMVSAARTLSDLENAITRLYAQFIAYSESSASLRSFKHNLEHLYRTNTSAFYGLIAIVALFIIWVLSTPLLLMLKILVLFFVLYSTWVVITASEWGRRENTRPIAMLGYLLLAAYLIVVLL